MQRRHAPPPSFASPAHEDLLRLEHGAEIRQGRRKLARPLDPKRPLQLLLRSSRARGPWSMLSRKHERRVAHETGRSARRFGIRILRFSNSGSAIHLIVRPRRRGDLQAFLRTATGLLARAVTGAKKGRPVGKFWDHLAYSRVLDWDSDPAIPRDDRPSGTRSRRGPITNSPRAKSPRPPP